MTKFVICYCVSADGEFIEDMTGVFGKCTKRRFPGQPKGISSAMYALHFSVEGVHTVEQLINMIPDNLRDKYGINDFMVKIEEVIDDNKSSTLQSLLNATDNMNR